MRRDPSTARPPLRRLLPTDELELLEPAAVNDFYHVVHIESGDTGWVWARNVRIESGPAINALLTAAAGPAAAIDIAWEKPAAQSSSFESPVRAATCGPTGESGDTATSRRKNRTDVPTLYHSTTFAAIANLEYPATRFPNRGDWPPESLAVIERYEGVAVQVTGFLAALKPQTSGSGESTNCYWKRSSEVDWHMALVEHGGDGEKTSIVVETTPRVRAAHPRWTPGRLDPWVDAPDSVRISGWLLFDPVHRNHLGRYRQTLWEIHPVTRIEVWQAGAWADLDSLP